MLVVSTCYAGAWIDALKNDETVVIASSAADGRGNDCAGGLAPSSFGQAFFNTGMRRNDAIKAVAEKFGLRKNDVYRLLVSGGE